MGRLQTFAPKEKLRGHVVRAREGETTLDASVTDGAGRFLLQWPAPVRGAIIVELLGPEGEAPESVTLTASELVSPAVVLFSGRRVIEDRPAETRDDSGLTFEADGDYPLCVTSSCIEVALSWRTPPGTKVSILSGDRLIRDELTASGSIMVTEKGSKKYTLRVRAPGTLAEHLPERIIEVRRYPSLSLVVDGTSHRVGSRIDLGVSLCCPAGQEGVKVTVLTSDQELVPVTEMLIPPGSSWAATTVALGSKPGTADLTATAPDFVQDGISLAVH